MLEDKCRDAIRRYSMISPGGSVVVGLSGGADSCALLHFLCSLRDEWELRMAAVHVNHLIRGEEAERDAAFAEAFCRNLGVDFLLYRRDVPALAKEKGIGLEQCGREVRYAVLSKEADRLGARIATAHTLSDSAETVLFHLIRGCSVSGLKGIPPVRGSIIRPLILCERADVEDYCRRAGIAYMTDSTNFSTDYARNRIRLRILPLMREMNPSVVSAIGRLAESARLDDEYLNAEAERAVKQYLEEGNPAGLFQCDQPVLSRALVRICAVRLRICPEQKHISAMMECIGRGEGSVNLPGNNVFRLRNHSVAFERILPASTSGLSYEGWETPFCPGEIITPAGQRMICQVMDKKNYHLLCKNDRNVFKNCLDYDKIMNAVFRFRREGDSFHQAGRNGSKSLKKLFNEAKIPPGVRSILPILESGGCIAWIGGIGTAESFKVTGTTKRVLYINADLRDIINRGGLFQ